MPPRRLLVIGTQCERLNRLTFLPKVAERLHALMLAPGPGGCEGSSVSNGDKPGLFIDPTVEETRAAMKRAIIEAHQAEATLILAYIGHGVFPDEQSGQFYLMPRDADDSDPDKKINFAHFLEGVTDGRSNLNLQILLDACHAGAGTWQVTERIIRDLRHNNRFSVLASTDDRATAKAPLTDALIEVLDRGAPELSGDRILARDLRDFLERNSGHPAQCVEGNVSTEQFHLGRNQAHDPGDLFWKDSPGKQQILERTWYFEPTPQLDALVAATQAHPLVVLTGNAGVGKTALMAALARPEMTRGYVPEGFSHAIALLEETTNKQMLAKDLATQLERSLPEFSEAIAAFERDVPEEQRDRLDFLPLRVVRPLGYLPDGVEVRIVLDGLDQANESMRRAIVEDFEARPEHVRLVISARPETPNCPLGHTIRLDKTPEEIITDYLRGRRVAEDAQSVTLTPRCSARRGLRTIGSRGTDRSSNPWPSWVRDRRCRFPSWFTRAGRSMAPRRPKPFGTCWHTSAAWSCGRTPTPIPNEWVCSTRPSPSR